MEGRFSSAKNSWLGLVLLLTALLPLLLTLFEGSREGLWLGFVFTAVLGGFLGWFWFFTFYTISQNRLHYRQGPFYGSIPINKIHKVERTKYLAVGMRPALDFNGLLVYYNKYDKIYLSPARQQVFIEALLTQNPAIEIKREIKRTKSG